MSSSIGPDTGGESSSIVNEGSFKDSVENGFQPFEGTFGSSAWGKSGLTVMNLISLEATRYEER